MNIGFRKLKFDKDRKIVFGFSQIFCKKNNQNNHKKATLKCIRTSRSTLFRELK